MSKRRKDFVTLREHLESLRAADDRRYAEVSVEKEKALKIKEVADLAALQLAREIQTYKDEKANELRSQIERERGSYATQQDLRGVAERIEATLAPALKYIATQQGSNNGLTKGWQILVGAVVAIVGTITAIRGWK